MRFSNVVQLNEHFKKSANLILDHDNISFLKSYILSLSNQDNLDRFVKFVEAGACAFTFTGPFGSGKSSFSLFISTLLEGSKNPAHSICLDKITDKNLQVNPLFSENHQRLLISMVGAPESPIAVISQYLNCESNINSIKQVINNQIQSSDGVVIIIDEMGKFLEQSAKNNLEDIFIFQELAELANNSNGKFILIGIMHQSLADYAQGLSKSSHDEWLKINGRFQSLTINTSSEEQLDLISKAIIKQNQYLIDPNLIDACINTISVNKAIQPNNYQIILQACWPLNPLVTLLLGPFSSKRFGQNQRSIFSFLSSQEAFGFQSFLKNQEFDEHTLYSPVQFWDYIKANFDFVLNASSDSKKWILAQESLDRCLAHFDDKIVYDVLKIICLIDLFKGNSGLLASKEILQAYYPKTNLENVFDKLKKLALIRETHDKKSLVLFEGSDFDLDKALTYALEQVTVSDFQRLNKIAAFQPIVAKRYYHSAGTMRWMNMFLVPIDVWKSSQNTYFNELNNSMFGSFIILIPKDQGSFEEISAALPKYSDIYLHEKPIIVSVLSDYNEINKLSHELVALEWIEKNTPALLGDRIARAEIEAHKNTLIQLIYIHLNQNQHNLEWYGDCKIGSLNHQTMSQLCSELADKAYPEAVNIRSEMLNTNRPSSNANAAINALLRRMVLGNGKERLGIEGHPAEWGVFRSVLEINQIYLEENGMFGFQIPNNNNKLADFWCATNQFLQQRDLVTLGELYAFWSSNPFGIKKGLHAILLLAYLLSNTNNMAVYLKEMYQPEVNELFVDYLIKESADIQIKYIDFNTNKQAWLENLLTALKANENTKKAFQYIKPNTLDISKKLVQFINNLNPWVMRTKTLSRFTTRLRDHLKNASDPNKLIFEDIIKIYRLDQDTNDVKSFDGLVASLNELHGAYIDLINNLGRTLFTSLQINALNPDLEEIHSRAETVFKSSGDFRIDALATRLKTFDLSKDSIAGIAGLAANKPISDWIDLDVERAHIEIASLCSGFKKAELYAHLKGKSSKRQSYAVIASSNGTDRIQEFSVLLEHQDDIDRIKNLISKEFPKNISPEVILAAMAELSLEFQSKKQDH